MAAVVDNNEKIGRRHADITDSVHVASREEALHTFDLVAQRYLNISGVEFLRRWDAGEYAACADEFPVRRVAMMRYIAR